MLLRVEIVASTQKNLNSQSQNSGDIHPSFASPLHINLNTASHHHRGIVLQVGRKNSDLSFPNEKSVSRTHCRLRLISLSGKEGDCKSKDENENNEPLHPANSEEEEVCKESIDGLAIVLEDLGSKFGTKAYYTLNNTGKTVPLDSKSDSETDDDETDEDDQSPQVNSSASSSNGVVKILEKNGSIVLPALSIPHRDQQKENQEQNFLTTTIQCGTAQFKVTRIPLFFCLSRTSTSDRKKIAAASPTIGAHITQSFNDLTTHLIAPDRTSTAKMICAWATSIPVVSSKFVMDLSERKEANSPLPDVENYVPNGTLPMDNVKFSNDEPRKIFNDYLILSLMETEAETICKCGGATIKKLYKDNDVTFWQQEAFFEELIKENELDKKIVCWLDCTSRKVKKGKDFLVKKMREGQQGDLRLRCIAQSQVVDAITELSILKDIDGVELTPATEGSQQESGDKEFHSPIRDQSADSVNSTIQTQRRNWPKKPLETIEQIKEIDSREITNSISSKAQVIENQIDDKSGWVSSNKSQAKAIQSASQEESGIQSPQENSSEVGGSNNSKSSMKKKSIQQGSQSSGWISSHNGSKSVLASKSKRSLNEGSQSSGWITSQKSTSKKSERKCSDGNFQLHLESINEEMNNDLNENKRKISLPMTSDGWYVAPKGTKRAKYKRDITDIMIEQGGPSESAQTEASSLIVRKSVTVHDEIESSTNQHTNQHTNKKDFKRFRKNSIIKGALEYSFNKIRFVSLLPKESERQRELQACQSELERRERAADSLFADSSAAKKRGIKSYLKPSAKSSSRRRG